MTKTTKRTYIALTLAGLLYNIYLVCHLYEKFNSNPPTQTEC